MSVIRAEMISAASSSLQTTQLSRRVRERRWQFSGFSSLHYSLSVKQKYPCDVQANVGNNGDVEPVRYYRRGGVHPSDDVPVESKDSTVRFAGGKYTSLWGNNCLKSKKEVRLSPWCRIKVWR